MPFGKEKSVSKDKESETRSASVSASHAELRELPTTNKLTPEARQAVSAAWLEILERRHPHLVWVIVEPRRP